MIWAWLTTWQQSSLSTSGAISEGRHIDTAVKSPQRGSVSSHYCDVTRTWLKRQTRLFLAHSLSFLLMLQSSSPPASFVDELDDLMRPLSPPLLEDTLNTDTVTVAQPDSTTIDASIS